MSAIPVQLVVHVERSQFGHFAMDVKLAGHSVMYERLTSETKGQAEVDALNLLAYRLGKALDPERATDL